MTRAPLPGLGSFSFAVSLSLPLSCTVLRPSLLQARLPAHTLTLAMAGASRTASAWVAVYSSSKFWQVEVDAECLPSLV
eukprot:scaffold2697_cov346-Pavlova_lutheri.AAC.17